MARFSFNITVEGLAFIKAQFSADAQNDPTYMYEPLTKFY
jgi:hypothetical protein